MFQTWGGRSFLEKLKPRVRPFLCRSLLLISFFAFFKQNEQKFFMSHTFQHVLLPGTTSTLDVQSCVCKFYYSTKPTLPVCLQPTAFAKYLPKIFVPCSL